MKDWTLVKVIRDEGYSAKHLKRPGLEALLAAGTAGRWRQSSCISWIASPARCPTSISWCDSWDRHDVALVSLQESLDATTATGRLMMNLLAERQPVGAGSHW